MLGNFHDIISNDFSRKKIEHMLKINYVSQMLFTIHIKTNDETALGNIINVSSSAALNANRGRGGLRFIKSSIDHSYKSFSKRAWAL